MRRAVVVMLVAGMVHAAPEVPEYEPSQIQQIAMLADVDWAEIIQESKPEHAAKLLGVYAESRTVGVVTDVLAAKDAAQSERGFWGSLYDGVREHPIATTVGTAVGGTALYFAKREWIDDSGGGSGPSMQFNNTGDVFYQGDGSSGTQTKEAPPEETAEE